MAKNKYEGAKGCEWPSGLSGISVVQCWRAKSGISTSLTYVRYLSTSVPLPVRTLEDHVPNVECLPTKGGDSTFGMHQRASLRRLQCFAFSLADCFL